MLDSVHNRFVSLATCPVVALLVFLFNVCILGFNWRQSEIGHCAPAPDGRFWYTPCEIREMFEVWGSDGRALYAWTEVTLDLLFPLVYGTLFAALLARLFRSGWRRLTVLVPLIAAVADLFENAIAAYLAWSYDGRESSLTWAAACFTVTKTVCFGGSLVFLLWGSIAGKFWRQPKPVASL